MAGDNLPLWYHLLYSFLPYGKAKRSTLRVRYFSTTCPCDLRPAALLYISREPAACVLRPRASIDILRRKDRAPWHSILFLIIFLREPFRLIQSIKIHNSVIANKPIESRLDAWLIEQKTLIMIYVESA